MITLFNWLPKLMGLFTFSFGGDSPAPAPTQTTVQNTNIPEYARPYVETMLGATQKQLFTTQPGADVTNPDGSVTPGTTEITGFQP